jgi:hypothetical protein
MQEISQRFLAGLALVGEEGEAEGASQVHQTSRIGGSRATEPGVLNTRDPDPTRPQPIKYCQQYAIC